MKINFCTSLGAPLLNMGVWVLLKYKSHHQLDIMEPVEDTSEEEKKMALYYKIINCPFFEDNEIDFFVYNIPVFLHLTCNTFFLVWIMLVSLSLVHVCAIISRFKVNFLFGK